jgi:hypothetical protein
VRPPRWTWPLFVLAALIVILILSTDQDARLEAYRVLDDDTIEVQFIGGTNWFWTRLDSLEESAESVMIRVRSFEWPVPHTDVGVPYELTVDLDAPLGERIVIDAPTGTEVPRTRR